jgi:flagellar hook assembly protein FlgD
MYSLDLNQLPGVASVKVTEPVPVMQLANHPNPFTTGTTITFILSKSSDISLDIFDLAGRKVKTLASGPQKAGDHGIDWDGTNEHGRRVASGIYFLRLETGEGAATRHLNLIR